MYRLTKKEYELLSEVSKVPNISAEKLAELFSIKPDSVVHYMDAMEEKDYVRITYEKLDDNIIHRVLYYITPKGEEALENYADIKKRNFWKSLESKLWKLVPILISLLSLYIAYAD